MSTHARHLVIFAVLLTFGCKEQFSNYCPEAPNHNCLSVDAAPVRCTSDQQCAPNVCDLAGSQMCVQCTTANPAACTAATPFCGSDNACHGCSTDQQCAPNVCDLGSQMCVQCTTANPAACTATTPVCGNDNACHGCTAHAECSSNVCLADGSCAAQTSVAYVAGGQSGTCSKTDPCGTLDAALQTGRPYVKLATGLIKDNKTTTIDGKTVTILADAGAKLDRDGDGAILVVQSSGAAGAKVQIFDVEITGATGTSGGDGIRLTANGSVPSLDLTRVTIDGNQGIGVTIAGGSLTVSRSTVSGNTGGGVAMTGAGSITVSQSTVSGNTGGGVAMTGASGSITVSQSTVSGNTGGGIAVSGTFSIVGNVFFNNGGNTSLIGGISIGTSTNAANRLEFNSFALNTTQDGVGPAVQCLAGTFTAKNNIMSDNRTPTAQADQFGGTCTHAFSIIRPGALPVGNSGADPMFVDPSRGNLHLNTTSPARRTADPNSDLTGIAARDIDGTSRTSPADIGAYQFKAQGSAATTEDHP
jgi:Right handed beta helix region